VHYDVYETKQIHIIVVHTNLIIIIIIYFPSVDPYRITKSKWIWKSSHFRENKE